MRRSVAECGRVWRVWRSEAECGGVCRSEAECCGVRRGVWRSVPE